jgi:ATP-GRASP peptide maturase of grasp-with-spasm system
MAFILSEARDAATNDIIDYLHWHGQSSFRFNEENRINDFTLKLDNVSIDLNVESRGSNKIFSEMTNFWYRRGDFSNKIPIRRAELNNTEVEQFLLTELGFIKKFFHENQKYLGNYYQEVENNKLLNLKYAKEAGLKIPKTLVTTNKKEAIAFINQSDKCITKPIHNAHLNFDHNEIKYSSTGTRLVELKDMEALEDCFCPMLLQEYTEKEVELRIFFLEKKLFPMAIFSQLDDQTKIDYRNYNREKPNRSVPFKLPNKVKNSILAFTKKAQLNTGSIDIILTKDNEYVFLEVNPVGQFGWVSKNCNYYIENEIALHLLK